MGAQVVDTRLLICSVLARRNEEKSEMIYKSGNAGTRLMGQGDEGET